MSLCPESHSRNHYASGLPDLEYKSKRILETAFRFSRPDRRLYRGCFYGKSRSLCYLFRRRSFPSRKSCHMRLNSIPELFSLLQSFSLFPQQRRSADTTAMVSGGLDRDITTEEISGSLACNGYASVYFFPVWDAPPVTSFSQNVGLINMTKVVNRFTIMTGAVT